MAIRDIMNGPFLNANIKRDAKYFYFGYVMGSCVFLTLKGIFLYGYKGLFRKSEKWYNNAL